MTAMLCMQTNEYSPWLSCTHTVLSLTHTHSRTHSRRHWSRPYAYVTLKWKKKYYYLHSLSRTVENSHWHRHAHAHSNVPIYTKLYIKHTQQQKGCLAWIHGQVFRRSDLFLSFTQCSRPQNSVSRNHFDSFSPHFTSYLFILIKHHISINRRT